MFSKFNFHDIRNHYEKRISAHKKLLQFLNTGAIKEFAQLGLGVSAPEGNYSAKDHQFGPVIIHDSGPDIVFEFGKKLLGLSKPSELIRHIYRDFNIPYLKIGIGSEMAAMLLPKIFWVANRRTIWGYLLVKQNWDLEKANYELDLYKLHDVASEMEYSMWRSLYSEIKANLLQIEIEGSKEAAKQKVVAGNSKYLWADAICNFMYDYRNEI